MSEASPKTAAGTRRSSAKPARSRSREFALQALYQVQVGGNDVTAVDAFTRELAGFHKADPEHYMALLEGCAHLSAVERPQAFAELLGEFAASI